MSDKRYEANIIRATAVEPANNLQSTSAPGVWSIDEVVELQKKSKWPTVGNVVTNAENVFSTFLYIGQGGSTATINNGIDLLNEGGLVWIKARNATENHVLFDTGRGVTKYISSNLANAEATSTGTLTHFYNNGFKVDGGGTVGSSTDPYVSWTFRKQAKFFDIVTYTGSNDGTNGQTISHNLGSVPGMILIKNLSNADAWRVFHRSEGATKVGFLNLTNAFAASQTPFANTAPTSTQFTLGTDSGSNYTGHSYVAYLFAHNNNDGGFGPDQDGDIIKCGSYTGNESATGPVIDLGFEPQWLMLKNASTAYNWIIVDVMRGFSPSPQANTLFANTTAAEDPAGTRVEPTSTGFQIITSSYDYNKSGDTFVYMAIRRPQAVPTAATQVFSVNATAGGDNKYNLGFVPDFNLHTRTAGDTRYALTRLLGQRNLQTNNENVLSGNNTSLKYWDAPTNTIDLNTAWWGTQSDIISWSWARARKYFDVVCYTGTGSARTVTHNLDVAPEMIWAKSTETVSSSNAWWVQHKDLATPYDDSLSLQSSGGASTGNGALLWNSTAPTSSVFSLGTYNGINQSTKKYVAYLFATLPGISKVGTFSTTGSDVNVDCGFTSGAKFILLKRTDGTGAWNVFDTTRGIVAGNDPYIKLNTDTAEVTGSDLIDPLSSGFTVVGGGFSSGEDFIFYAIAT
jgi:hypothetical protein